MANSSQLLDTYVSGPESPVKAQDRCGGSKGLLRLAAEAIKPSEATLSGAGACPAVDDEARALIRFAEDMGLMMDAAAIRLLFQTNKIRGGSEHDVAHLKEVQRVIKDLNVRRKATESLFDYLTDFQLANFHFGDDIQLEGFYQDPDGFHIVTSQPLVEGVHPDWETLKAGLEFQGLRHAQPLSRIPSFILPDSGAGEILVIDVHENNVILGRHSGSMEPIDAHFYFDSPGDRIAALQALGLWRNEV